MSGGAMPTGSGGMGGGSVSLSDYGEEVVNASHLYNGTIDTTASDIEEILFGNSSYCILTPESEVGPFCTFL